MEGGFEGGPARPPPVPRMVMDFVQYFYRHIRERNVRESWVMYSHTFPHLSERFFKGTAWPTVDVISHLADDDHIFCILYKEMYYRHLYANAKPTLAQRVESWDNYRELFGVILNSNLNMQLPNGWLWDMVDEFVYQFQSFCQYRGKVAGKTPEEIEALRRCEGVWEPSAVATYLLELVTRSGIQDELQQPGAVERLYESDGYHPAQSNVRRMLGYFSLIGLLRVHSVLGDYTAALQSIFPLNPHTPKFLFTSKIAMSHITLFYYSGFAYLMLQRYLDAAKCFNTVLTYIAKVKQHHQRGVAYDQILKKNEQMYALLAAILSLCPAAARVVEDSVQSSLREKYGEKMRQMASGAAGTYEELFAYACPKFVAPSPPDYANPQANTNLEAYRAQLAGFMSVVDERRHLPALKQFLKLYSSISVPKLARLAEMDDATLRSQLALMRQTGQVVTWTKGDALQGSPQPAGDIEFSIEKGQEGEDMVVVAEAKAQQVKGDFLARHIHKFEEIIRDLETMPPPSAAAPQQAQQPAVAAH